MRVSGPRKKKTVSNLADAGDLIEIFPNYRLGPGFVGGGGQWATKTWPLLSF